jgi:hypothetical protein
VTATDSTGASGSATFTWTISGAITGGTCQVAYATQSHWSGGFVAGITVTNTGTTAVNGWTRRDTHRVHPQRHHLHHRSPADRGSSESIRPARGLVLP